MRERVMDYGEWERKLTNTHFLKIKLVIRDVNGFHLLREVSFRFSFPFIFPSKVNRALKFYFNWSCFFLFFNWLNGDLLSKMNFFEVLWVFLRCCLFWKMGFFTYRGWLLDFPLPLWLESVLRVFLRCFLFWKISF
jgi:hypothetical protein